ncbi:GDSL family lipase [Oleiharenicola lentus]|uniref:GDSL family lipase n=1 Tax=Oleiharenicola lentus TaxID=2508720 RepID=A0A4Q1C6P9_9BACT|nr:GDSL-type esterase/lipase family protein [Oleiharenicola lentus]RXK54553.1 GDSL family lipase [Oleiharenicola lentus]
MNPPLVRIAAFLLPLLAFAQTPPFAPDAPMAPDQPPVPPLETPALNPALPTLFIAGDSTAEHNRGGKIQGWGVPFAEYFDPTKINVANHAVGGRSTRTFISGGRWEKLLAGLKQGDFVIIQFGHNDGDDINERPPGSTMPLRARGTLPGTGSDSRDIVNALTQQPETVHSFGWYLRKMVADVKAKGATPILASPTLRNLWPDGRLDRGIGRHRDWSRDLAREAGVAFVDHSRIIADSYQVLGKEAVNGYFGGDHTHTNAAGADFNASAMVAGLKGLRPALFKDVFSAKGAAVKADEIGWLALPEPADPKLPSLFFIGDSTVRNGGGDGKGGQWGWGDFMGAHLDFAKLNLVNRAIGGLTGRSFVNQGHWARALLLMKPGDFVVIQFGHNDGGSLDKDPRARVSLPGTGEETQEVDNAATGQKETVHTNGWYLRKFVREARAAGVTPVLCSLVPRKIWKDGKMTRATAGSAVWAREVAAQEGVAFVDLNGLVADRYDELGWDKTNLLFADEHTHTSREGAIENALIVARALRALPGDPLAKFAR